MRFLKVFGLVLLFLISMMFFIQNTEMLSQEMSLHLNFYIGDYVASSRPLPFYFLLLFAFALGSFLVLLYFLMDKLRLGKQLNQCRHERDRLEQEVNSLRNLPLESSNPYSASAEQPEAEVQDDSQPQTESETSEEAAEEEKEKSS